MLCEANGGVLQRAFALEANHLQCHLCLHDGQEIDTGVTPAGLFPQYVPGHFAPGVDNPFNDLQSERVVKSGLYRIQIDVQLDSLRRVQQAKEFTKATKSDDAEIPVYLWNKGVEGFENAKQHD